MTAPHPRWRRRRRRRGLGRRLPAGRLGRRDRTGDRTAAAATRGQTPVEAAERRRLAARYRQTGGRRGQRRRFAGRILFEPVPVAFEASTGTLEAIYPFQTATTAASGRTGDGLVVGPSVTGGIFGWDPWTGYRTGRLTNPNLLILGDVGSGKSALAKTLVWRGLEFGRGAHIIDPKGEYAGLAEAAGTRPVALRPGGGIVLNPLDPGAAGAQLDPADLYHRNLTTLRALIEATLGRDCRQVELVTLAATLARVCGHDPTGTPTRHGHVATLPALADALVKPDPAISQRVNMDPGRLVDETRELMLALARLVDPHGDLAGMFAGPTNLPADALSQLTVVDVSAIYRHHRDVLGLVMIATAAWLQLATTIEPRGRFQVNDEAWALLADEAAARWMQTNQKLSRQLSLSVVNVLHRLSDTAAAGAAGSTTRALAEGVITDSGTCVIYRQKPSEQPLLAEVLQLNQLQTRLVCQLPRGRGLWIIGGDTRQVTLADHLLTGHETRLVDTDQALRAADPDPDTQVGQTADLDGAVGAEAAR